MGIVTREVDAGSGADAAASPAADAGTPALPDGLHGFVFHGLGGAGRLRFAGLSRYAAEEAAIAAVEWLRVAERKLSRFQPDSLVTRLNRGESVPRDADLVAVLRAGAHAQHLTQGRIDVTAHPLWSLWHDPRRAVPPGEAELAEASARCGRSHLEDDGNSFRFSHPGAALDLGGVGKEWCVDQVALLLERRGIANFLVELAGDVVARGRQSPGHPGWWVLLLRSGYALPLFNSALATSGHRARSRWLGGKMISHLIDATTGWPASGAIEAATALASSCLEAGIAASDAVLADTAASGFKRLGAWPGALWVRGGECQMHSRLADLVRPVGSQTSDVGRGLASVAA